MERVKINGKRTGKDILFADFFFHSEIHTTLEPLNFIQHSRDKSPILKQ